MSAGLQKIYNKEDAYMVGKKVVHVVGSFLGALVLLGLLLLLLTTPVTNLAASEASIMVDTLDDELNNDGDCSLREAIQAANDDAPVDACPAGSAITDTITFSSDGTILLGSPLLIPTGSSLVIDAGGTITISGGSQVRIFVVYIGAELTLRNLTLVDGFGATSGGAIYNDGSAWIENSALSENAVSESGGAVYNSGTMDIDNSTLYSNSVSLHYGSGGAIYNSGTLNINGSIITDNRTPLEAGRGGGIYNSLGAVLSVSSTQFLRNTGSLGGGINNDGQVNIYGSSFEGNIACSGGGFLSDRYTDTVNIIMDSTIYDNHAISYPGVDWPGQGGGILVRNLLVISNTTISANSALYSGGGIYGRGVLTLTHSTVVDNHVVEGTGHNILLRGDITFRNSIITGATDGQNCDLGLDQPIDDGYNIEDGFTCGLSPASGSMPGTDPMLDTLQDNGGSTLTHALLPGSPALDGAKPDYCPPADQRGIARPVDGDGNGEAICDIGSFESRRPTMTMITSDQPDPSQVGAPFTTTFSVTTTFGIPTGVVIVAGGKGTCSGELLDGNGSCQMTLTGSGTYTLTATYNGDGVYEISHGTEIHVVLPGKVYLPLINKP